MKQLNSFKNAIIYKVKKDFSFTPALLAGFEKMASELFFPEVTMRDGILRHDCFTPPVNDKFIYTLENKIHYIRFKTVKRQIPNSVIKRHVSKQCRDWFEKTGRVATKSQKSDIKHDVICDLSVHAFKVDSYIDVLFTNDYIIVGTGSGKAADDVTAMMRKCFGSLPAVVVGHETKGRMAPQVTRDISAALEVNEEETDPNADASIRTLGFNAGDAVSLTGDGQWSGKDITLDSGIVKTGLDNHMSIGKVQLSNDYIEFDLDESLFMKAIKFSLLNPNSLDDEVDANMVIVHDNITQCIERIAEHLDGWRDDELQRD